MSPKLKKDYAKATKKVKRMINGFSSGIDA